MGKVRKQTGDRKGSIPRKGCVGGPRAPSRFQGFLVHSLVSLRGSSRAFCRQHSPQGRGTRSQADVTSENGLPCMPSDNPLPRTSTSTCLSLPFRWDRAYKADPWQLHPSMGRSRTYRTLEMGTGRCHGRDPCLAVALGRFRCPSMQEHATGSLLLPFACMRRSLNRSG